MELLLTLVGYLFVSFAAGLFGSLLGLGGGLIVVPALTLGFGLEIRYAIGASMVCLIATSSGAAAAYVRDRLTNIRVAMFLETGTATGALVGALAAGFVEARWLYLLFGSFLAVSSVMMLKKRSDRSNPDLPDDPLAVRLDLAGSLPMPDGKTRPYKVYGAKPAWLIMVAAGVASGLLGIGSGALKVPAMDLLMKLPIKASSATSNFMIGVTATTGAAIYLARGDILPQVAGPVALGVLAGSFAGARLLTHIKGSWLRVVFFVVICLVAAQMLMKGIQ